MVEFAFTKPELKGRCLKIQLEIPNCDIFTADIYSDKVNDLAKSAIEETRNDQSQMAQYVFELTHLYNNEPSEILHFSIVTMIAAIIKKTIKDHEIRQGGGFYLKIRRLGKRVMCDHHFVTVDKVFGEDDHFTKQWVFNDP